MIVVHKRNRGAWNIAQRQDVLAASYKRKERVGVYAATGGDIYTSLYIGLWLSQIGARKASIHPDISRADSHEPFASSTPPRLSIYIYLYLYKKRKMLMREISRLLRAALHRVMHVLQPRINFLLQIIITTLRNCENLFNAELSPRENQ